MDFWPHGFLTSWHVMWQHQDDLTCVKMWLRSLVSDKTRQSPKKKNFCTWNHQKNYKGKTPWGGTNPLGVRELRVYVAEIQQWKYSFFFAFEWLVDAQPGISDEYFQKWFRTVYILISSNFCNTIFVSSHMYPENPEGTQVIVGFMNMG